MGQGSHHADQPLHDGPRLPIVVAQENREAADPFDQRGHIRLAELLAELDQIAFPVSELLSVGDNVRAAQDVQLGAEALAMPAPGMARTASRAVFRQMPPELDGLPIRRVGEFVDRLVADRDRMALKPHPPRDLLWRPAVLNPFDDRLAHMREARELPQPGAPLAGHVMRRHAMVAVEFWPFLVDEGVAP